MVLTVIGVWIAASLLFVVLLLAFREVGLRRGQRAAIARMREDRQVAELEAAFDLEWEWPR